MKFVSMWDLAPNVDKQDSTQNPEDLREISLIKRVSDSPTLEAAYLVVNTVIFSKKPIDELYAYHESSKEKCMQ